MNNNITNTINNDINSNRLNNTHSNTNSRRVNISNNIQNSRNNIQINTHSKNNTIKFVQINLHHAKGATAVLCKKFSQSKLDIALIQEPWANNYKVLGISTQSCKLIYDTNQLVPRTAILVNGKANVLPITEFIKRDIVAISIEVPTSRGVKEMYVASAYFPGDEDNIPPTDVTDFIAYCKKNNKPFIIGCDANAHHTVWSSTDVNNRGELLLEYIIKNNIDISNKGCEPTFVTSNRNEVLDLTLCSPILSENVKNWHVSDEISLSDHRQILFEYQANELKETYFRNPRKTDWDLYYSNLQNEGQIPEGDLNTIQELENASEQISSSMLRAFHDSCPTSKCSTNRDVSWWNNHLQKLRKKARKLFNKAKRTMQWDLYKSALTEYNKEIRKSKRMDWRRTCESIENTPVVARLQKVLSKDHTNGLGTLKKENNCFTSDGTETLEIMMKTHFPGSIIVSKNNLPISGDTTGQSNTRMNTEIEPIINRSSASLLTSTHDGKNLADEIFTDSKVEWAINTFEPFKSPGRDGIYPALLQKSNGFITPSLIKMFKASFVLGYVPSAWRKVRVVFIPKANKKDKTSPKSFRPISLSSIILKIMEKLIDHFIKSKCLINNPLNKNQFAYQSGKSTITALHTLVSKIEKSLEAKEILLATFLDIEGAFDNASHNSMANTMLKRGFNICIVTWISEMLSKREISAELGSSSISVRAVKGCPQGGVLSPLLWSLVVDDLLTKLESQGFEVIGFADDIVIIIRGKYDDIITNRMQQALNFTIAWCKLEGLGINPHKTHIIPFTKRRKIKIDGLHMERTPMTLSSEVKYLGVTIDRKLNWNSHLNQIIGKATNALWISKRTFGNKWGLRPVMIQWIYTAIIRPRITYASFIWWPKTKEKCTIDKLNKLQRLILVSTTGAMRSAPTNALNAILNLLPLHQFVQLDAGKTALRLQRNKTLITGTNQGHLNIINQIRINPLVTVNNDWMETKYNFNRKFNVVEPNRSLWSTGGPQFRSGSVVFFTDGSKQNNQVGAGVTGPGVNISVSMGGWPTVFQAEIQAILECATVCLKRKYKYANICIFSDSQAALNALKSFTCTSKLVWECIQLLQQLSNNNTVNLYWVPGHCGVEGNEKADELARLGSSEQLVGPEPFCGVSPCSIKMELRNWEKMTIVSNWNNTITARQSKKFVIPNVSNTQKILALSKKDLCTYIGLITGHCPAKYHLKLIKKIDNDICRFCNEETETSEHLLCLCPALFNKRAKFFDKGLLQPFEIWFSCPNKVVRFIRHIIPNWEQT